MPRPYNPGIRNDSPNLNRVPFPQSFVRSNPPPPNASTNIAVPQARRSGNAIIFEYILRSEDASNRIRQYFAENPARWAFDRENLFACRP
jgi:hypothetical protein